MKSIRPWIVAAVLAIFASVPVRSHAADDASWQFKVTPYLWLPSIQTTVRYPIPGSTAAGSMDVEIGADDYIDNITLALLATGEIRRGRAVVMTDLFYTRFSGEQSRLRSVEFGGSRAAVDASLDAGTESSLTNVVWSLAAGYALMSDSTRAIDVVGGFRYTGLDASTDWRLTATITGPGGGSQTLAASGSVDSNEPAWDAIVGTRAVFALGSTRWFTPLYADIGGGSSALTWQVVGGVGYRFSSWDMTLVYRHLQYEGGDSDAMQEMSLSGAALGFGFRF